LIPIEGNFLAAKLAPFGGGGLGFVGIGGLAAVGTGGLFPGVGDVDAGTVDGAGLEFKDDCLGINGEAGGFIGFVGFIATVLLHWAEGFDACIDEDGAEDATDVGGTTAGIAEVLFLFSPPRFF